MKTRCRKLVIRMMSKGQSIPILGSLRPPLSWGTGGRGQFALWQHYSATIRLGAKMSGVQVRAGRYSTQPNMAHGSLSRLSSKAGARWH